MSPTTTAWEAPTAAFAPVAFDPGPPPPAPAGRAHARRKKSGRTAAYATPTGRTLTAVAVTKLDLCLRAVAAWEATHEGPMPQAEAVLAAWRLDQPGFGMLGHAGRHPCSNRVIMELVKGVGRGFLVRPEEGHYRLTRLGRDRLAELPAEAA